MSQFIFDDRYDDVFLTMLETADPATGLSRSELEPGSSAEFVEEWVESAEKRGIVTTDKDRVIVAAPGWVCISQMAAESKIDVRLED